MLFQALQRTGRFYGSLNPQHLETSLLQQVAISDFPLFAISMAHLE